MTIKHSVASKARWSGVSTEERSKKMRAIVKNKWKNMTKKQRAEQLKKMIAGRTKKKVV